MAVTLSRSVERSAAIMNALAAHPAGVGASSLARELGLDKSTTYRLLRSLTLARLVHYDSASTRYRLGGRLVELGLEALDRVEFLGQIRPFLSHLRELTGETAAFYMRVNDRRAPIVQAYSPQHPRVVISSGYLRPLDVGAAGKVIVAYETEEFRRGFLDRLVSRYGYSEERAAEFASAVELVRTTGYAIGVETPALLPVASSIAFPVFNVSERLVGALAIIGMTERWTQARMLELLPECRSVVLEASEALRTAIPLADD